MTTIHRTSSLPPAIIEQVTAIHRMVYHRLADALRIAAYLYHHPLEEVSPEQIILHAGADPLRLYPILYDLHHAGLITISTQWMFGSIATAQWTQHLIPPPSESPPSIALLSHPQ